MEARQEKLERAKQKLEKLRRKKSMSSRESLKSDGGTGEVENSAASSMQDLTRDSYDSLKTDQPSIKTSKDVFYSSDLISSVTVDSGAVAGGGDNGRPVSVFQSYSVDSLGIINYDNGSQQLQPKASDKPLIPPAHVIDNAPEYDQPPEFVSQSAQASLADLNNNDEDYQQKVIRLLQTENKAQLERIKYLEEQLGLLNNESMAKDRAEAAMHRLKDNYDALMKEKSALQSDYDNLQGAFEKERSTLTQMRQENETLIRNLDDVSMNNNQLKNELEHIKDRHVVEIDNLSNLLEQSTSEVQAIRNELADSVQEKDHYKEKLSFIRTVLSSVDGVEMGLGAISKEWDTYKGEVGKIKEALEEAQNSKNKLIEVSKERDNLKARIGKMDLLIADFEQLKNEYDQVLNEKQTFQERIQSMESTVEQTRNAKEELNAIIAERDDLVERVKVLEKTLVDLEQLRSNSVGLETQNSELKRSVEDLERNLMASEKAKSELKNAQIEIDQLKEKVTSLQSALEDNASIRRTLDTLTDKRDSLESRLNEAMEELSVAKDEKAELTESINSLQAQYENVISDLQNQVVTTQEQERQVQRLTEENSGLTQKLAELGKFGEDHIEFLKQIDELQHKVQDSKDECEFLKKQNDELMEKQAENEKLQEEYVLLKSEFDSAKEEFQELQSDFDKLQEDHSNLKSDYESYKNELTRVEREWSNLRKEYDAVCEEKSNIVSEFTRLIEQFEDSRQNHGSVQKKYDALNLEYEQLMAKHTELQQNLEETVNNYEERSKKTERKDSLKSRQLELRVKELDEEVQVLQTECNKVLSDNKELLHEKEAIMTKLELLENELNERRAEDKSIKYKEVIEKMKEQLMDITKKYDEYRSHMEEMMKQYEEQTQELEKRNNMLESELKELFLQQTVREENHQTGLDSEQIEEYEKSLAHATKTIKLLNDEIDRKNTHIMELEKELVQKPLTVSSDMDLASPVSNLDMQFSHELHRTTETVNVIDNLIKNASDSKPANLSHDEHDAKLTKLVELIYDELKKLSNHNQSTGNLVVLVSELKKALSEYGAGVAHSFVDIPKDATQMEVDQLRNALKEATDSLITASTSHFRSSESNASINLLQTHLQQLRKVWEQEVESNETLRSVIQDLKTRLSLQNGSGPKQDEKSVETRLLTQKRELLTRFKVKINEYVEIITKVRKEAEAYKEAYLKLKRESQNNGSSSRRSSKLNLEALQAEVYQLRQEQSLLRRSIDDSRRPIRTDSPEKHFSHCKTLVSENLALRFRLRREAGYRSDLIYQKNYILMLMGGLREW